jgi:uncharacterized membrane protein YtjA (UPF0391 family)
MVAAVGILLFVAVMAAIFGFTGLVLGAVVIAKALFGVFLLLFLAVFVMSLIVRSGPDTVP